MTAFDNLSDVFNVKYEKEPSLEEKEAAKRKTTRKKKQPKLDTDELDKPFIKDELITLVSQGNAVMALLEEEIKVGANPRFHETYGSMMKVQLEVIDRLRSFEKDDRDYKLKTEAQLLERQKQEFDRMFKIKSLELKAGQPLFTFNQQNIVNSPSDIPSVVGGTQQNTEQGGQDLLPSQAVQQSNKALTTDDIFDLIHRAKSQSSVNTIVAEFSLDEVHSSDTKEDTLLTEDDDDNN